jgi:ankyrin repeat protein
MKFFNFLVLFALTLSCMNSKNNYHASDIELFENSPVWTLAKSVKRENVDAIKSFCHENPRLIDYREKKLGFSLLHWAVYNSHLISVQALLEAGADPNVPSNDSMSAFIEGAGKFETSEYLKLLLKFGGNVNAKSKSPSPVSKTALIAACHCRLESVRILVEAGADINYISPLRENALISACRSQKIEIAQYLIMEKNADFKLKVGTILNSGDYYIIDLFRDMTFPLNSNDHEIKMEVVKYMKEHGVDYWKCPIPEDYYGKYDSFYLQNY